MFPGTGFRRRIKVTGEPCEAKMLEGESKRRLTRGMVLASAALAAVAAAAAWVAVDLNARWRLRFGCVEAGALYRSAQPTPKQLDRIISKYGIRTIVNLRRPQDDGRENDAEIREEEKLAAARGVKFVNIPYTDKDRQQHIAKFLDVAADPSNRPILVHCSAGKERSGVMVAAYRIRRHGWTLEQALREMESYGFDPDDGRNFKEAVEEFAAMEAAGGKSKGKGE
jgi:uncharacterized protein (TIGR01244 family)